MLLERDRRISTQNDCADNLPKASSSDKYHLPEANQRADKKHLQGCIIRIFDQKIICSIVTRLITTVIHTQQTHEKKKENKFLDLLSSSTYDIQDAILSKSHTPNILLKR